MALLTVSRPGIESWTLDLQSKAQASQPWTSINFQLFCSATTGPTWIQTHPPHPHPMTLYTETPICRIRVPLMTSRPSASKPCLVETCSLVQKKYVVQNWGCLHIWRSIQYYSFPWTFCFGEPKKDDTPCWHITTTGNQHPNVCTWQNSVTHHAGVLLPRVNQHSNVHTWQNLVPLRWHAQILRRTGSHHRPDLPPQGSDHTRK